MGIFASFYREESGENRAALLLQEVYHIKRKLPVVFGCIYVPSPRKDDARELLGGLLQWFYGEGLYIISKKGRKALVKIAGELDKYLSAERLEEGHLTGILIVGANCVIFRYGAGRVYLMKKGARDKQLISLLNADGNKKRGMQMEVGEMEDNVEILLATEGDIDRTRIVIERKE